MESAARNGHLTTVQWLVENGAQINGRPKSVITPLSSAVISNHLEVVKYLLNHGAEVNHLHRCFAKTALDFSLDYGHIDLSKLLKVYGGISMQEKINWQNEFGGSIIEYINSQVGPVYPRKLTTIIGDNQIDLKIANIDNKYKLLFTIGLFSCQPRIEYFICLPHEWPLDNSILTNGNPFFFPVSLLLTIAEYVLHGDKFLAGDLIRQSDKPFENLLWPPDCDEFIVIDQQWNFAEDKTVNEDTVLLYVLIPIALKELALIDQGKSNYLITRLRQVSWGKISLKMIEQ